MARIKAFVFISLFMSLQPHHVTSNPITTIIFSFNTLFRPDAQKIRTFITNKLTIRNYLSFLWRGIPKSEEAKQQMFEVLAQIPQVSYLNNVDVWKTPYPSYETSGHKFPPIFCQLLTSQTHAEEKAIFATISSYINDRAGIASKTRRKIIHAIVETIFQTHNMNQFVEPLDEVVAFARTLKNHGYQIIINGNVPGYAWDEFVANYPQGRIVQELFPEDHRFISGTYQTLKSSKTMYDLILTTHNLNPEQCLALDTNYNNLRYPQSIGLKTYAFDTATGKIRDFKNSINQLLS